MKKNLSHSPPESRGWSAPAKGQQMQMPKSAKNCSVGNDKNNASSSSKSVTRLYERIHWLQIKTCATPTPTSSTSTLEHWKKKTFIIREHNKVYRYLKYRPRVVYSPQVYNLVNELILIFNNNFLKLVVVNFFSASTSNSTWTASWTPTPMAITRWLLTGKVVAHTESPRKCLAYRTYTHTHISKIPYGITHTHCIPSQKVHFFLFHFCFLFERIKKNSNFKLLSVKHLTF